MRPVSTGGVSYAKTCGKRVPGEEKEKTGDPQEGMNGPGVFNLQWLENGC